MIRVAVFDDSPDQLEAMKALLMSLQDITCVGAFQSVQNIIEDVKACKPDVALIDVMLPEMDGIRGVAKLRSVITDVKVVMLTVIEDDERILDAIKAGADGYFLKQTKPDLLVKGIREVQDGGAPMSPRIARKVLGLVNRQGVDSAKEDESFRLSSREAEILKLLVKGWTYKRIAAELEISFSTVNKHVSNVYKKLQVGSVGEAVAKAIRNGLA